ncbi:hypothetical protein [Shewanella chilikensis]|uniref:hypothetical protein n=1 Tax=Shewanella chilikensis TaxID=558541 RepID=UPI00399B5BD8
MALYFVSYDLNKQKNYQKLYAALENLGAIRMLDSAWCFKHNDTTCTNLREYLANQVDNDDSLIVSEVVNWSSWNVVNNPNKLS